MEKSIELPQNKSGLYVCPFCGFYASIDKKLVLKHIEKKHPEKYQEMIKDEKKKTQKKSQKKKKQQPQKKKKKQVNLEKEHLDYPLIFLHNKIGRIHCKDGKVFEGILHCKDRHTVLVDVDLDPNGKRIIINKGNIAYYEILTEDEIEQVKKKLNEELIPLREVSNLLGIKYEKLYDAIYSKRLDIKIVKENRRIYVPSSEIEKIKEFFRI